MNLREYLMRKYGPKNKALSTIEARAFGVPYPLQAGWLDEYGHLPLTKERARRILESFTSSTKRGGTHSHKESATAVLMAVIDGVPASDMRNLVPAGMKSNLYPNSDPVFVAMMLLEMAAGDLQPSEDSKSRCIYAAHSYLHLLKYGSHSWDEAKQFVTEVLIASRAKEAA
ncbi:hypothetical protein [Paraburkholderia antibiotica]|uniref:Uncharacterized protein n=1 Tax=Paraburkholderia antibiotica TaxID=2728839 RepID=A0A7Y0A1S0_9BURK|nr:hypothetical protein [Paraburkholderia antibiotica]NML34926.1 hypothetical protein [Paraburkholderia antibiotica]